MISWASRLQFVTTSLCPISAIQLAANLDHCAAGGISFEVRSGEVFGRLGPGDAGESTTIVCLCGLRRPDGCQPCHQPDGWNSTVRVDPRSGIRRGWRLHRVERCQRTEWNRLQRDPGMQISALEGRQLPALPQKRLTAAARRDPRRERSTMRTARRHGLQARRRRQSPLHHQHRLPVSKPPEGSA